ncbi:hypothetical protein [Nocardia africana]|uniref:hypothetical protein n=1 Tax=Nocardia africana TaxID=134964 RepID=UPI001D133D74|nr:hypothetical protein [Nocardia africana]MCC3316678.1 hypothetical protein [Nocardia africana]
MGISPSDSAGFGLLAGRVADLCAPGDLACDAPTGSPLTQTVKNIAAQSNLGDPVAAISTIAQALAATTWKPRSAWSPTTSPATAWTN